MDGLGPFSFTLSGLFAIVVADLVVKDYAFFKLSFVYSQTFGEIIKFCSVRMRHD